jgi:hypothetical protein
MKNSVSLIALSGAILLAAGCGKSEPLSSPQPPAQAASGQAAPSASVPVPPLPDPVVPKGAEAPTPKPGQAGDHSSPAFKDGGKPNPAK